MTQDKKQKKRVVVSYKNLSPELQEDMADAILMGTAYWLVSYEPELIRVITPEVMLLVSGSVLIFGVVITFLCAYLSINKYLRMKASTLYYI